MTTKILDILIRTTEIGVWDQVKAMILNSDFQGWQALPIGKICLIQSFFSHFTPHLPLCHEKLDLVNTKSLYFHLNNNMIWNILTRKTGLSGKSVTDFSSVSEDGVWDS